MLYEVITYVREDFPEGLADVEQPRGDDEKGQENGHEGLPFHRLEKEGDDMEPKCRIDDEQLDIV